MLQDDDIFSNNSKEALEIMRDGCKYHGEELYLSLIAFAESKAGNINTPKKYQIEAEELIKSEDFLSCCQYSSILTNYFLGKVQQNLGSGIKAEQYINIAYNNLLKEFNCEDNSDELDEIITQDPAGWIYKLLIDEWVNINN